MLAVSVRQPDFDIALIGCRNAREIYDGVRDLSVPIDDGILVQAEEIMKGADRLTETQLGLRHEIPLACGPKRVNAARNGMVMASA